VNSAGPHPWFRGPGPKTGHDVKRVSNPESGDKLDDGTLNKITPDLRVRLQRQRCGCFGARCSLKSK
jgi:hypothetical protein